MPERRRRTSLGHIDDEQKEQNLPKNLITAMINKRRTLMLLDTGACISCISEQFVRKLGIEIDNDNDQIMKMLVSADGQNLKVKGQIQATINLKGLLVPHSFVVIDGLNYNVLLGCEFMKESHCKLDLQNGFASFYDDLVILPMHGRLRSQNVVRAAASVELPAASEAVINVCEKVVQTWHCWNHILRMHRNAF